MCVERQTLPRKPLQKIYGSYTIFFSLERHIFKGEGNPIKATERQQALSEAMGDHRGKILAVIRRMVRDQAEAEDVLQDVFTEFLETYDLGHAIETLGAWLMRVAKNKTIDRLRRRKTRESSSFLLEPGVAESAGPEEESLRAWLREEILAALELLPERQRDVFLRHEIEGKSFEEIAKETGENINTLLSRKRQAVLFLRNHLKEVYDELE